MVHMHKLLTVELLDDLIRRGYRYFLSRTTRILGEDADICITLLPVKKAPSLKNLSQEYDTYFKIGEEPRQMALGIDETLVLVDLSKV